MSDKAMIMLGATVGGAVGGYIPTLLGADVFSAWGILGGLIGGLGGIWLAWRYIHG